MVLAPIFRKLFGHYVRTVNFYGQGWLVAKDLYEALDIQSQPNDEPNSLIVSCLDPDERRFYQIDTVEGIHEVECISRSGFYKLLMRSNKMEAKEFQNWLALDVISAIGDNGKYVLSKSNAFFRHHR